MSTLGSTHGLKMRFLQTKSSSSSESRSDINALWRVIIVTIWQKYHEQDNDSKQ